MTEDAGAGWLVNTTLSSQPYQYCHLGVWPLHSQNQYASGMRWANVDAVVFNQWKKTSAVMTSPFRRISIFFSSLFLCVHMFVQVRRVRNERHTQQKRKVNYNMGSDKTTLENRSVLYTMTNIDNKIPCKVKKY